MPLDRRDFLKWTAAGGIAAVLPGCHKTISPAGPGAAPASSASEENWLRADPRALTAAALAAAKAAGASYADVRLVRVRRRGISVVDRHVSGSQDSDDQGLGVRVLVAGRWGFAADPELTTDAAARAARMACAIAGANALIAGPPVVLAPTPSYTDRWQSRMERDPFAVALGEQSQLLLAGAEAAFAAGAGYVSAEIGAIREHKFFASSEGSFLEQTLTRVSPRFTVTVVDAKLGEFEARDLDTPPALAGYEHILAADIEGAAPSLVDDCRRKLAAPAVVPGKRDLVLDPTNLWLTIHESVGHPTELDRAVGLEANFAGTSFCTVDKLDKLDYGSKLVSIYADRTSPGGLATCGYDDEGVKTGRWDLLREGRFVGYQTTRDQAAWIGERVSRGCSYADSWASVQFQRMPNVSLAPSKDPVSRGDLVAGVDDGLFLVGTGSWSIDQQRYNFQFTCQMAYEIKGGVLGGVVKHAGYQANSLDFWRSCDGIGGEETWRMGGSFYDGKGEPMQTNAMSHGCPVARFRGVNIINARKG